MYQAKGAPRAVPPEPMEQLGPRPAGRLGWRLLRWGIILAIWSALAATLLVLWFARDLPRPEDALDAVRRPSLVLQDQAGNLVATYGDVVGDALHLSDMPAYLPAAAVSIEDRRFWSHSGIDPLGIARAVTVNVFSGRLRQGGSTITQQVAKTLFLTNARTMRRKVQELLLTLWLERHFTKQEILEIWLNRVYLGAGAWGVDAGARVYFGISARKLALWQAAVLAGLPRAPSRFNPRTDPSAAAARAHEVLAAMVQTGAITAAQAADAAEKIRFSAHIGGGWFADWATSQADAQVPPGTDAVLRSTLDSRVQTLAETRLRTLLDGPGVKVGASQGAVVVLDAATGAVRALVGGRNYADGAYNRATQARRQPRLRVQGVCLARRPRTRPAPRRHRARRPIAHRQMEPGRFRARLARRSHPGAGLRAKPEHRLGAPGNGQWRPRRGCGRRPPPRHRRKNCRHCPRSPSAPARSACSK